MPKLPVTSEFMRYVAMAHHIRHAIYCEWCKKETDHNKFVNGDREYYTCPYCGNTIMKEIK